MLIEFARSKVDIILILETKSDKNFQLSQFKIGAFNSPYWPDFNSSGGVVMLSVWEDIPGKLIDSEEPVIYIWFL